jgi:trans-2,3-dihydro-3-hydroxyanthranilate isomerase
MRPVPRSLRFVQCDVFSSLPLAGNALAVFTDARGLDDGLMAAIARETNLSETVFVLPPSSGGDFRLRIFTPSRELPFAGHPVIGAAATLGRSLALDRLALETGAGTLPVVLGRRGGVVGTATMEQPPVRFETLPAEAAAALCRALAVSPQEVSLGDNGVRTALVRAGSEAELAALAPNVGALARLEAIDTVSVHWAPADQDEPVRVRVFAPAAGIAEDPGTGAAAGPLGELLVRRGERAAGAMQLLQGVEVRRPCLIRVHAGDGPPRVGGDVTPVARGTYVLP